MQLFAWCANVLVFTYKLPQIYKLYKAKETSGLSVYSFCIQAVSYILYILHGYFNNDIALLYGMILPLVQNLVVIALYFRISRSVLNHSDARHALHACPEYSSHSTDTTLTHNLTSNAPTKQPNTANNAICTITVGRSGPLPADNQFNGRSVGEDAVCRRAAT